MDLKKHASTASYVAIGAGGLGMVGSVVSLVLGASGIGPGIVLGVSGVIFYVGSVGGLYLDCNPSQSLAITITREASQPAPPAVIPAPEPEYATPTPSPSAIQRLSLPNDIDDIELTVKPNT